MGIQGLVCVSCRGAIEAAGLSCTACGATFHAECHRRETPAAVDWAYSGAVEIVAVLFADGSIRLTRASGGLRTGAPVTFAGAAELAIALDAWERADLTAPYGARLAASRVADLAGGERAVQELARFLRGDVLARFSRGAAARLRPAAGDALVVTWRPGGFSQDRPRGLRITLIEHERVLARAENAYGTLVGDEIELPSALLPPAPAPQVGATLVVHR